MHISKYWNNPLLTVTKASNIDACILSQFSNRNSYRNDHIFLLCWFKWNGHCCCSIGININWNLSVRRIHRLVSELTDHEIMVGYVREYLIFETSKRIITGRTKTPWRRCFEDFYLNSSWFYDDGWPSSSWCFFWWINNPAGLAR